MSSDVPRTDSPGSRRGDPGPWRALARAANAVVLLASGAFLAWSIARGLSDLRSAWDRVDAWRVVLSFALFVLFSLLQSFSTTVILRFSRREVAFARGMRALLLSLLGKYLPGKIWVLVLRLRNVSQAEGAGVGIFAATAVEHVFLIGVAVLYGSGVGWTLSGDRAFLAPGLASLLAMAAVVAFPDAFCRVANRVVATLRIPGALVGYTRRQMAAALALTCVGWSLFFVATWQAAAAIAGPSGAGFFRVTGAYALSVVGGFLAVFSPGGFGVRESLFVLMDPMGSASLSAVASVVLRLAISVSELAALALAHLLCLLLPSDEEKYSINKG